MYRIIKIDGTELGITDEVLYIRKHENGAYVQCEKEKATGIAIHSTAYHLLNRDRAEDYENGDVIVSNVDGGEVVGTLTSAEEKNRAASDYNIMMGNLDDPEQEANDGAL